MGKFENKREATTLQKMVQKLENSGHLYVEFAKTEIAENIYLAMKREDVSKAELARRLGKSRAYVTQILQGGVNFTIESLVRIATVLDCELDMRLAPNTMIEHWNLQSLGNVGKAENSDNFVGTGSEKPTAANTNELALAA
ncbi:MAG TPA: helix-turn-helix transcriptional regulator [Pyrinomonadaceae bacterium]|nr:helix-turn-helix transcriptional regulator [Pyrinomonadaceae bacterium]